MSELAAREYPHTLARHLDPKFLVPPHVEFMGRRIRDAVMRPNGRLVLTLPPRHGKSLLSSRWTPLWFLEVFGADKRVMLASYGADFASEHGRWVRNSIDEHADRLVVRLADDSKAANRWETTEGGGMVTTGIGGSLTGRGADCLILDDVLKNDEESRSDTAKQKHWDWLQGTALTRLQPNASVIVIGTRWSYDDIIGRILEDGGDAWEHVDLPALARDGDALNRAPGEPLWPKFYDADWAAHKQKEVGRRVWAAEYQQTPSPETGGMFRTDDFRYFTEEPEHYCLHASDKPHRVPKNRCRHFCIADTAMTTRSTSDYTVLGTFAITPHNHLLVVSIRRKRLEVPDQFKFIVEGVQAARRMGPFLFAGVESKGSGIGLLQTGRKMGFPFREVKAVTDKVSRASPVSVYFENHKVFLHRDAQWLQDCEHELLTFPHGRHDDQVDVIAYAFNETRNSSPYGFGSSIDTGPSVDYFTALNRRHYVNDDMDTDMGTFHSLCDEMTNGRRLH